MMLQWVYLLVAAAAVSGDDVQLGDRWTTFIPNELIEVNNTWSLKADEGTIIKVFCPDFRFPHAETEEEACQYSKIAFDDGVEKISVCGTQYDFQVIGKSSKMTVTLTLPEGSAGQMECLGKAVQPPKSYEEINVAPSDGVIRFNYSNILGEDDDKAWLFKSTSDWKISLQCDVRSEREQGGVCIKDIITVDNGEGPKQQCGYDDLVAISSGKEITLRIETYPTTKPALDCKVQAISGPNPNEYENVEGPEEESPEQGVARGLKETTCDCGKINPANSDAIVFPESRIINGTETHEGKYPFMVSLRSPGNWHFCGASIISPVHILTAAHCVSDSKTKSQPVPADLVPTVGAHSNKDSSHGQTQKLKVKKVSVPNEWFTGKGLAADIAILHLETPIKFSKWVSPVCLSPKRPAMINKFVKHMGWGDTGLGPAIRLREADVQVLDNAICNRNPKEVCFLNGPSTACYGDSGGPFVFLDPETNRYTQVAVASYVYNKCYGNYFIGTNTATWYNWIKDTMAEIPRITVGSVDEFLHIRLKVETIKTINGFWRAWRPTLKL